MHGTLPDYTTLNKLKKVRLVELAQQHSIPIAAKAQKPAILAAIKARRDPAAKAKTVKRPYIVRGVDTRTFGTGPDDYGPDIATYKNRNGRRLTAQQHLTNRQLHRLVERNYETVAKTLANSTAGCSFQDKHELLSIVNEHLLQVGRSFDPQAATAKEAAKSIRFTAADIGSESMDQKFRAHLAIPLQSAVSREAAKRAKQKASGTGDDALETDGSQLLSSLASREPAPEDAADALIEAGIQQAIAREAVARSLALAMDPPSAVGDVGPAKLGNAAPELVISRQTLAKRRSVQLGKAYASPAGRHPLPRTLGV